VEAPIWEVQGIADRSTPDDAGPLAAFRLQQPRGADVPHLGKKRAFTTSSGLQVHHHA